MTQLNAEDFGFTTIAASDNECVRWEEGASTMTTTNDNEKGLQIFNNVEFGQVRVIEVEGKPYAVGVDVARALEYTHPSKAIIDHCKGITKLGIPSYNQHGAEVIQETNIIPEGDIYRLIIKAASQSRSKAIKEKAERFERWIFDEVLPSIRKHGAYMTPETITKALSNPDFVIQLVQKLKDEQEQNKLLSSKIEQDAPKVIFANAVAASTTSIPLGDLATILQQNGFKCGRNKLFALLRDTGYLIKAGTSKNMPTQKAMTLGVFEVKESSYVNQYTDDLVITKTTLVTGTGQVYFVNKFLKDKTCYDVLIL